MSYIVLRVCWFDVIVSNVHAPTEEKIDDLKDSFCEDLEQVVEQFQKYRTNSVRF